MKYLVVEIAADGMDYKNIGTAATQSVAEYIKRQYIQDLRNMGMCLNHGHKIIVRAA
jgi:hypothetical protein